MAVTFGERKPIAPGELADVLKRLENYQANSLAVLLDDAERILSFELDAAGVPQLYSRSWENSQGHKGECYGFVVVTTKHSNVFVNWKDFILRDKLYKSKDGDIQITTKGLPEGTSFKTVYDLVVKLAKENKLSTAKHGFIFDKQTKLIDRGGDNITYLTIRLGSFYQG